MDGVNVRRNQMLEATKVQRLPSENVIEKDLRQTANKRRAYEAGYHRGYIAAYRRFYKRFCLGELTAPSAPQPAEAREPEPAAVREPEPVV